MRDAWLRPLSLLLLQYGRARSDVLNNREVIPYSSQCYHTVIHSRITPCTYPSISEEPNFEVP